jgi:hypothetical protein
MNISMSKYHVPLLYYNYDRLITQRSPSLVQHISLLDPTALDAARDVPFQLIIVIRTISLIWKKTSHQIANRGTKACRVSLRTNS